MKTNKFFALFFHGCAFALCVLHAFLDMSLELAILAECFAIFSKID